MDKLTNRQRRFVEFYLQSWNASDAARRAGYTGEANKIGSRLLTNVDIQAAIHERMAETAMQTDEALHRLAEQARFNLTDVINDQMRPTFDSEGFQIGETQAFELDWEELRRRGHLIKSITSTPYGPKIEAYDGQAALFKISHALGLLVERVDMTSKGEKIEVVFYLPGNGRDDVGDTVTDTDNDQAQG